MRTRIPLLALAALLVATGAQAPQNSRILPDVHRHLRAAADHLENGNWAAAEATSELLLLNRPLRVWLEEQDLPLHPVVQAATDTWESHFPALEFVPAESREMADVVIDFVDDIEWNGQKLAGHIRWRRSVSSDGAGGFDWAVHATIRIRTLELSRAPMSFEAMQQAVTHELGHVLGLADCEGKGNLMGALETKRPLTQPNAEEIRAVQEVRDQATWSLVQARLGAETDAAYNASRASD